MFNLRVGYTLCSNSMAGFYLVINYAVFPAKGEVLCSPQPSKAMLYMKHSLMRDGDFYACVSFEELLESRVSKPRSVV